MPRVDVIGCDVNEEDSKIEELFNKHNFSRLIIYDETIDHCRDFTPKRLCNLSSEKAKVRTGKDISILTIVKEVIDAKPLNEFIWKSCFNNAT